MQFQITTVESETMKTTSGDNFQITTFEQTTNVFCDCCDNQSTGTKDELRRRGWGFGNGCEFCPECN